MKTVDRRKSARHSRAPLPVGSIVVRSRKSSGGSRRRNKVRFIKIRNSGPFKDRWQEYGRWLWEREHGPVPPGKRIAHLDGDTLNDSLDNLGPLSAADVLFLWHERDAAGSARNRAACRAGTARMNRDRAAVRRQLGWVPTRWYAVHHADRIVLNHPCRMRWQALAAAGQEFVGEPDFPFVAVHGRDAALLGYRKVRFPSCRVCGCTELNCRGCIERTGDACSWVEDDLCSACVPMESPCRTTRSDRRASRSGRRRRATAAAAAVPTPAPRAAAPSATTRSSAMRRTSSPKAGGNGR